MSGVAFAKFEQEVEMLSYNDRIKLLEKIIKTLGFENNKKINTKLVDFDAAFGIWQDREVSLESIREKAWART